MSTRAAKTSMLPLGLDRKSRTPLEKQVYVQLRDAILRGQIRGGARIPSTRSMATELECSRNTVVGSIAHLTAEGYLVGRRGSGTYVASVLPEDVMMAAAVVGSKHPPPKPSPSDLSKRAEAMVSVAEPRSLGTRPFDLGVPDVESFPFGLWARILAQVWRHPPKELLFYGAPAGHPGLREEISSYLRQVRGVHCGPEQVFITCGAQQAFDFLGRLLLDPGDRAFVEEPGYVGTRGALVAAGATVVPIEVDDEGISIGQAAKKGRRVRAVVVTPSHQYPLGVVMSIQRRAELLDWAEVTNAWIIEDDYDGEFRYSGPPLTSLQGLAAARTNGGGRVIYVGSFSKVLFPGLRLGYMILPSQIVDRCTRARRVLDGQYPNTIQPVMAEFLRQGHFLTHMRRMRHTYYERQQVLLKRVAQRLGDRLLVHPHDAGMHLLGDLRRGLGRASNDRDVAQRAAALGVYPKALSEFYLSAPKREGLILGYAGMSKAEINRATKTLAEALA